MKSSVMKQRFRAGTAVLVVLMLILSVFPSGIFGNLTVEALPTGAVAIVPSETGTGKKVFNTSGNGGTAIVTKNSGPSGNNVTYNNTSNYYVGNYTYTSRYLTYKADFYDYLSDEEVTKGRGDITNSRSEGFTDPYTYFNQRISGYQKTSNQDASKMIVLEFRGTWPNYDALHAWAGTSTNLTGDWNTYNMFNNSKTGITETFRGWRKDENGDIKYTLILEFDLTKILNKSANQITETTFNFINFNPDKDSDRYEIDNLELGYRYVIYPYWDGTKSKVEGSSVKKEAIKAKASVSNYTYPLYFGCFWLSDYNYDYYAYESYDKYTEGNPLKAPLYNNFYWPANISLRNDASQTQNDNLRASVTGLVNKTLNGGSTGTIADPKTNEALPYFSDSWANANSDVVKYWKDVDFPFYEIRLTKDRDGNDITDDNGENPIYYQFNSRDTASLYLDTTNKKIYEHRTDIMSQKADVYKNGTKVNEATKGFYPFNDTDSSATDGTTNNLGFGVKYTIPFVLTEDGKIKGIDTVFEFMGDDDVWVFIDGKLALDMGGAHKDAYGKINFAIGGNQGAYLDRTASITKTGGTTVQTMSEAATAAAPSGKIALPFSGDDYVETANGGKVYNTSKVHYLTMFFMERGMWESDCFIRFNFIRQNILNVKNNLVVNNVNSGFVNKTYEAANYDVFDYKLENQIVRTRAEEVSSSGLPYEGGRSLATRQVYNLNNTLTGLNTTVADTAKGNYQKGNFVYNVFKKNVEDIDEGSTTEKLAVHDTYFQRYDDYMVIPNNDTGKRYVTGKTDENGYFDLQYGQKSTFVYQFYSDSLMYLVQQDTLKKLENRTSAQTIESKVTTQTERKASDLYTTVWKLYDIYKADLGQTITDQASTNGVAVNDPKRTQPYDNNTKENFQFQNQQPRDNVGVNITAEYTNEPRVGELKIKKQIVNAEKSTKDNKDDEITETVDANDTYDDDFIINVKFTKIFGQTDDNGDSINLEKDDYTGKGEQKGVAYYVTDKDGKILKESDDSSLGTLAENGNVVPEAAVRYMKYDDDEACGTITIKRNQTAVICNIPVYTEYTITESDQTYHKNYNLVVDDGTQSSHEITKSREKINGTIAEGTTQILNIVNNQRQLGDLVVEKTVAVEGDKNTGLYSFKVTLKNNYDGTKTYDNFSFSNFKAKIEAGNSVTKSDDTVLYDDEHTTDTTHEITENYKNDNKIEFTTKLKHGEKLTITDIPYGTQYTVEETGNDKNTLSTYYDVKHTVTHYKYDSENEEYVKDGDSADTTGTTGSSEVLKWAKTTDVVTNTRKTGDLTIDKKFFKTEANDYADALSEHNDNFTFTVTLTKPDDLNDATFTKYASTIKRDGSDVTLSGNTITFNLKIKGSTTITGLPYGTTYDVAETTPSVPYYYKETTYTDSDKIINSKTADKVTVVNTDKVATPIVMPSTGGDGTNPIIFLLPFGIIAITLAGAALLIYRKKLSGEPLIIHSRGDAIGSEETTGKQP
ncbi:MAG: hypothetical protein IJ250_00815 [Bacteroidales bacterium]|nr:hypothetical protein [Bacteroidales bacterium]